MNKMRTLFVGVAFAAVLFVGTSAQALTTFSLTVGGASAITVAPSTSVTVDVVMTTDIATLAAYGVSTQSGGVGTMSSPTATAVAPLNPAGGVDCSIAGNTQCSSWSAVALFGTPAAGTYTIGTFVLHAAASGVVNVGEFNLGVDGTGDATAFNGLAVTVPEPSTAALMLVGLAGLARVGRRD